MLQGFCTVDGIDFKQFLKDAKFPSAESAGYYEGYDPHIQLLQTLMQHLQQSSRQIYAPVPPSYTVDESKQLCWVDKDLKKLVS